MNPHPGCLPTELIPSAHIHVLKRQEQRKKPHAHGAVGRSNTLRDHDLDIICSQRQRLLESRRGPGPGGLKGQELQVRVVRDRLRESHLLDSCGGGGVLLIRVAAHLGARGNRAVRACGSVGVASAVVLSAPGEKVEGADARLAYPCTQQWL